MVQLSITEQQLFFYILTNINKTSLAITTTDISYKLRYNSFINIKVDEGGYRMDVEKFIELVKEALEKITGKEVIVHKTVKNNGVTLH